MSKVNRNKTTSSNSKSTSWLIDNRNSPVPDLGLEGYPDEVTVAAGDRLRFMISGPPSETGVSLVRLRNGDPNPAGPGYREAAVNWGQPRTLAVTRQHLDLGSYVEIPHSDSMEASSFTLALWFYPTCINGGWHALAAKWVCGDLGFALYVAGDHILTSALSYDGETAVWMSAYDFVQEKVWQFCALTYDSDLGQAVLCLSTGDRAAPLSVVSKEIQPGPIHQSKAPLLFGATHDIDAEPARHWAHFNGKLANPILLGTALSLDEVARLARGEQTEEFEPLLGLWDFSREVASSRIVDLSTHGNHGKAINAPARAVTGPYWDRWPTYLYSQAPDEYNAIYLHDDDLDDAKWQPSVIVEVPQNARSGIYALRVERDADRLFLPFVVNPPTSRSSLGVLVPTLTWQAYSSNTQPYSYTDDGVLDRVPCLYNV